jgi:hypothetical protein
MFFNFAAVASATFAFAAFGNAHLIMKTPTPFGVGSLNNSPLNDAKPGTAESDYPCKQRKGVYDISEMNKIAVETPTLMTFEGSASHGGGTCQIAITLDKEPTANSTFKIIQVFEGGCPTTQDSGSTNPFTFTLPKETPNGQVTLAWLWYNRIGNREAYMNCAPVEVSGGSDNDDYFNSLPNMYLINLPTSECQSTQNYGSDSVIIPNPGQYILKYPQGQSLVKASGNGCKAAADAQLDGVQGYKPSPIITDNGAAYGAPGGGDAPVPSGGASSAAGGYSGGYGGYGGPSSAAGGASGGYGGPSSAAGGASGSAAPSAAPSGYAGGSSAAGGASSGAAPSGSYAAPSGGASSAAGSAAPSGMVTISVAPSGAAPSGAASSAPAYSAPAGSGSMAAPSSAAASGYAPSSAAAGSAAPSYAAPSAAPSGGASTGGSCSGSGVSCSDDGKQFGLCDNGSIVWQPVAAGTSCQNGAIVKRAEMKNVHVRKHAMRHVH